MTLIKYNNRTLRPAVFNLLGDIFGEDLMNPMSSFRRESIPAVNIREDEKSFTLEMAVPGLEKKDINVEVDENVLTISSESSTEAKEDKDAYSRREFHYNSFRRSFNIPEEAEGAKIEARHENGILSIILPKKEAKQSLKKQITVS